MALHDILDPLFTYEGRLATFQSAQSVPKRRTSSANSKAPKPVKWPHPSISPEELAKAGLFYYPSPVSPDNVACFLCKKSLDGWEEDDDPLVEHLKHAPECGWAIVASIGAQDSGLRQEYPLNTTMIEARTATFADKWPHEDKKGWVCKVKQLADAGWKYTPTAEADDMTTCTYCELALDGWEPKDKPLDEHHKRSPDCAFFLLIKQYQSPHVKAKAKRGRPSKASRLSTQSNFTILSEAPSFADLPAEEDDSILTTATNATMTSQGGKKTTKSKKATTAKGRKTKAKKDEPVEVEAAPELEDNNADIYIDSPPKATRGRKRKSEEMSNPLEEIWVTAPEPKRRTTRTRASMARKVDQSEMEYSVIEPEAPASENQDEIPAKKVPAKKRGRPSGTKSTRKTSRTSAAAKVATQESGPADDEIDQALEANLESPLTDDEDRKGEPEILPPETWKVSRAEPANAVKKATRSSLVSTSADHAMFDAKAVEIDDATLDAELQAMEEESKKPLPKAKGAKGKQPRKPSAKQLALAAKKAAEEAEAQAQAETAATNENAMDIDEQENSELISSKGRMASSHKPAARKTRASILSGNDANASLLSAQSSTLDFDNETNASIASEDTVIRGRTAKQAEPVKRARAGRKVKKNEPVVHEPVEDDTSTGLLATTFEEAPGIVDAPEVEHETREETTPFVDITPEEEVEIKVPVQTKSTIKSAKARTTKAKGKGKAVREPSIVEAPARLETAILPPAPKVKANSSTKRGAAVEVSQPSESVKENKESTPSSPQSSDAENHPPSSKPSTTKHAELQQTPQQVSVAVSTPVTSPSKRNAVAGLASTQPWTSVDLEAILLRTPSSEEDTKQERVFLKEIGHGLERISKGDQALTSPEKRMTVEEWIQLNAGSAEEKLRADCERMVGVFEREGGRAMRTLEGIECHE